MKITPLCASCILARRAVEVEEIVGDSTSSEEKLSIYRSILETASLYMGPDIEAALFATMTFRRLKNLLNNPDPYSDQKRLVFQKAKERAVKIRDFIEGLDEVKERLRYAIHASTLASTSFSKHIFSKALPEPPTLNDVYTVQLLRDDSYAFYNFLESRTRTGKGVNIAYITGSVSELPYDYILLDILREEFGAFVYAIVRKGSYEDFVSVEDSEWTDIESHVDQVVSLESDVASIITDETPRQVISRIEEEVELVIVKNCLNTLTWKNLEYGKPWLAMFYAGCPIIASIFQVPPGTYNAFFSET